MRKKLKAYLSILVFTLTSFVVFGQQEKGTWSNEEILKRIGQEQNDSIQLKRIGILVYDGFFELDAIGPQAALGNIMGAKVFFVAPEKGFIKGSNNTYQVDTSIDEVDHLDVLLVPGGLQATYLMTKNQRVLDWIRKIDEQSTFTASVCTGSWILGAAGVLKGKKATSNWYRAKEIMEGYGAHFEAKRWVRDGKYWTSAGVSAGIDMGLAMVMASKGATYTSFSMLNLEYDPQPPMVGGSVPKTNPGMVNMLKEMYDAGLKEVKDQEK